MNDSTPADDRGKILVIDDNPTNLHILAKLLREANYDVRAVTSGAMALTVIPVMLPDLILLDIRMPQMDGYEVCQHLKNNPTTGHIPIIFLSALSDVADKVKAFEVGGVDYISKPFRIAEVLARVNTHLSLKQLQQQLQLQNDRLKLEIRAREQVETTYRELTARDQMTADRTAINPPPHPLGLTVLAAALMQSSARSQQESALELQQHFQRFEQLADRHGLTTIPARGTVYLVGAEANLPKPVAIMAEMALAMQQTLAATPEAAWQLQMGMHTTLQMDANPLDAEQLRLSDHPLPSYALGGEAIAVAIWLQHHATPGGILVSPSIYDHLQAHYALMARDIPLLTAEGHLRTYWLKEPKLASDPVPSADLPPLTER
jgi:DNA-binding response OmpR family regulator